MATDYHRKVGWLEIVMAAGAIYGLIWLELHVPGWEGWVFIWSFALWLAFTALRLAVLLYRLLK
jgi:hypothetical protein